MREISNGYPALRRGRHSCAHADYFLTLCARRPCRLLCDQNTWDACAAEWHRLESQSVWTVRCAVAMPDHLHLLVTLGQPTELSAAVKDFKGRLSPIFRLNGLSWQPSFYDHRLRSDEDVHPVFLYIFLNPYRAGLCATDKRWPAYYCSVEDWSWFGGMTNASCPYPEWLA